MWPGLKMVNGKPRHSQSQGSVERANRDIENLLACWQAENNSTQWSRALNFVQFQKNSKWHKGINREPYLAMFGRQPAFGLKGLSIPDEVIDTLETEDELIQALGQNNCAEEMLPTDDEIELVTDDLDIQDLNGIPFVIEAEDTNGGNDIVQDLNNSSMHGCIVCSTLLSSPSDTVHCSTCDSPSHKRCLQESIENSASKVCTICLQKEIMDKQRRGTKRKQEQQAAEMLAKSARRYKQAKVGDSVMVHLPYLFYLLLILCYW